MRHCSAVGMVVVCEVNLQERRTAMSRVLFLYVILSYRTNTLSVAKPLKPSVVNNYVSRNFQSV